MKYQIVEVNTDLQDYPKIVIGSFPTHDLAIAWIYKARKYRKKNSCIVHAIKEVSDDTPDVEPMPAEVIELRQTHKDRSEPQEQTASDILKDIENWTGIK